MDLSRIIRLISAPYVETEYDGLSRTKKKTIPHPNGTGTAISQYEYDDAGYKTIVTNPDGGKRREVKNYLGQISQVDECKSNNCSSYSTDSSSWIKTLYSYNAIGKVTRIRDDNGKQTAMSYDMLGRETEINDPDTGTTIFEYDNNNNIISQQDNAKNVISFQYDALNRVKMKCYGTINSNGCNATQSVSYTYDTGAGCSNNCRGQLTAITHFLAENKRIKTEYKNYDKMGQLKKVSQDNIDNKRTTEYRYDLGGRVTQITYPYLDNTSENSKIKVNYTYHEDTNLIHTVSSNSSANTASATFSNYKANGNIGRILFGNGVITNYSYNNRSLILNRIRTGTGNGGTIQNEHMDLEYSYFSGGNIHTITDKKSQNNITHTYAYDSIGRLTSANDSSDSSNNTIYTYNDNGNMLSRKVGDQSYTYSYPTGKVHAVTGVTYNSTEYSYSYNNNGDLTAGPYFGDGNKISYREISYNVDNLPDEIIIKGCADCPLSETLRKIKLAYSGGGERVIKKVWEGKTYKKRIDYFGKIFQQSTPDSGDNTTINYIFAGNLRLASLKTISDTSVTHYFHKDHLGSTSLVTGSGGEIISESQYFPYGDQDDSTQSTNYLFTDQEFDNEVGLYNYKSRLYDPFIGRFTTADSIVPDLYSSQSLNRYSYCLNNPLKYTDPTGHSWKIPSLIIGTAVALTVALPVVVALGIPTATVAAVSTWAAEQTMKKLVTNFHIGIMAKMYDQTVVPYVQDTFGLNDWETSVFSGVSFMGFYSGTSAFGLRTWRTMSQLYLDLQEGAIRGFMLGALNEFFEGESSPYKFIFKTAIQRATDVRGTTKYLGLWAMDYMDYRAENQSKIFEIDIGDSLNSAFRTDLTGFSSGRDAMGEYRSAMTGYYSAISEMRSIVDNFGSDHRWDYYGDSDSGGGMFQGGGNPPTPVSFSMISVKIRECGLIPETGLMHIAIAQMNMRFLPTINKM